MAPANFTDGAAEALELGDCESPGLVDDGALPTPHPARRIDSAKAALRHPRHLVSITRSSMPSLT
jgi:hypothetical protein